MKTFSSFALLLLLAGCATDLKPGPKVRFKNETNPAPIAFVRSADFEAIKPLLAPYCLSPEIVRQLDPDFLAGLEYR